MTMTKQEFEQRYADYVEKIAAGLDPNLPEDEKKRLLEEKLDQALAGDLESIIAPHLDEVKELLQAAEQADAVNGMPVANAGAPTAELSTADLAKIRQDLEAA